MEEGESGEAAKNMEQANVSSVTGQSLNITLISSKFYHYDLGFEKYENSGMGTLRENAVRKRIGS